MKTNGSAVFGLDTKVVGMLYASIERSGVFLGRPISCHRNKALTVPGVKHVFEISRKVFGKKRIGITVLADSYWAALQGCLQLNVVWEEE